MLGEMYANQGLILVHKPAKRANQLSTCKHLSTVLLILAISATLVTDLFRFISSDRGQSELIASPAWASWIGEVPTAAELYSDEASNMPSTEAFEDDDDDEELDASATNEYPDNENDESYEDADDQDNQESKLQEHWLKPKMSAIKLGGHAIWSDFEGLRRNKRDLEDRIVLASRRAARRNKASSAGQGGDNDDFSVDDGDEDAWVHDGVDDIHIDPETKRAASELSYDEKSIDDEYRPYQQNQDAVMNRTRITTITDVIPMNVQDSDSDGGVDGGGSGDSSRVITRFLRPPGAFLPAAWLTMDQVQRLFAQQEEGGQTASTVIQTRVTSPPAKDLERPLTSAGLSMERRHPGTQIGGNNQDG